MLGSQDLTICVVVKRKELRSPPDEHRVTRAEHDLHASSQALRPLLGRAKRRSRPVVAAHQVPHIAAVSKNDVRPFGAFPGLAYFGHDRSQKSEALRFTQRSRASR